jgi:hypothetical protein
MHHLHRAFFFTAFIAAIEVVSIANDVWYTSCTPSTEAVGGILGNTMHNTSLNSSAFGNSHTSDPWIATTVA